MILICRGREPDSLLRYRKEHSNACYENLPKQVREDIRAQMWDEQRGLCAYCMCQIRDPRDVRIEHYSARHPKDSVYDPQNTLDFKKMLAVCYGNSLEPGTKKEDTTCDAHKGNKPLTINPYDIYSIRKIRYTSDGYITSDDDKIKEDVQDVLNLNSMASSLPENRKNVLLRTKIEIRKLCKNKRHDTYLSVLNKLYKRYTEDRKLIPYCGIVISWLEKELKITERTTDHEPYSTRKK